jgi:hypothetical protein
MASVATAQRPATPRGLEAIRTLVRVIPTGQAILAQTSTSPSRTWSRLRSWARDGSIRLGGRDLSWRVP